MRFGKHGPVHDTCKQCPYTMDGNFTYNAEDLHLQGLRICILEPGSQLLTIKIGAITRRQTPHGIRKSLRRFPQSFATRIFTNILQNPISENKTVHNPTLYRPTINNWQGPEGFLAWRLQVFPWRLDLRSMSPCHSTLLRLSLSIHRNIHPPMKRRFLRCFSDYLNHVFGDVDPDSYEFQCSFNECHDEYSAKE